MKRCGAEHPETGVQCRLPDEIHLSHSDMKVSWDNPEAMADHARRPKRRDSGGTKYRKGGTPKPEAETIATINAMSARTTPERHVNQFFRASDPDSSREAAQRYEPKRETAKARVLDYLRARVLMWVDAPELTTPEVGGFAGTRRLRELRDDGWPIETRPKPGATNLWQHRLTE